MHRRTAHGNRFGLGIVGALLVLIGAAIVLLHRGTFGAQAATAKIYPDTAQRFAEGHLWVYWIAATAALVIALLAPRWLLVQPRTDRVQRLVVDNERAEEAGSGRTSVTAAALVSAIEDDARAITGVRRAAVTFSGPRDAPELWMKVTVDQDADTGDIRGRLLNPILADARTALEMPEMPAYLTLVVGTKNAPRVLR